MAATHRARRERFSAEARRLAGRSGLLANLRLVFFLAAVGCAVAGLWHFDQPAVLWLIAAGGALAAFVVTAVVHGRTIAAQGRAETLAAICADALSRLDRDWSALPVPAAGRAGDDPLAVDLDLFGSASLFQLLGTVQTPPGRATLSAWLRAPAAPEEIEARQAAVASLAPQLDFRQEFECLGRPLGQSEPDVEPFLAWAESDTWLMQRPWLIWLSRLLPALLIGLLLADGLDWIPSFVWMPLPIVHLLLTAALLGRSRRVFERLAAGDLAFESYARLFDLAAMAPRSSSKRLADIVEALGAAGARRQMARLERIQGFCDLRRSTMAYLPVQALLLWDLHCWLALERWQRSAGRRVRDWFRLLGELEALCALAGLQGDHPDWATAGIRTGPDAVVEAADLGHPLLPPHACVRNDVRLGPAGTFLLVTGSNMSGKSTLLRAVGVNLILAQAGGPVCARSLSLPPCTLGTSFRIRDSLAQGVSYFMAELRHLKRVVDLARETRAAGERVLVYLFDEILLGTNVIERQVAVRRVLEHLLELGAIGAIATHDLHLAEEGPLAEAGQPVHFRERFETGADGARGMSFDYIVRPGLAPTTNALKLLELVGLYAQAES